MNVPVAPHPPYQWVLSVLLILAILVDLQQCLMI